tara:strand:- start:1029 stop:1793 length:765 start_codon:yes stop_codon:yes gene_type:complete
MNNDVYEKLVYLKDNNNISNILLYGDSISGKKTILEKFINYVYNSQENINKYVIILNCSHGKGNIKFIRENIKYFSNTVINKNDNVDFKMIILINADKLTYDAQSALRRCIEVYNTSTRFFIIMDDKNKLMKPILSRFSHIYVNNDYKYSDNDYKKHYNNVYNKIKNFIDISNNDNNSDNSNNLLSIKNLSYKIFRMGISADMLIEFIKKNKEDCLNKYKFLLFFNNNKTHIRNECFLIFFVLYYYYTDCNILI